VVRRIVVGGGLAVALAGVFVVLELGRAFDAAPASVEQPPTVKIKFVSAPPGAEVRLAGTSEVLGITPFARSFPRSERAATFELAKPGFATVTQEIPLAGDDAVAVALTPAVPGEPPLRPEAPAAPAASDPDPPPGVRPATHLVSPPADRHGRMDVIERP
jgi:hypothetical protein